MNSDPNPDARRPWERFRPAGATPARYCLLATFAGVLLPVAAAVAVLGLARSGRLRATTWGADLAIGVLAVLAAVGVALLAQAAWRRWSLPQPGLAEFLPHRWLQRRNARRTAERLLAELSTLPSGPSPRATGLLTALATALATTDPYQRGRPQRRAKLCAEVGRELGLTEAELRQLQLAAQLQDMGLAALPTELLDRRGALDEGEEDLVRRHPAIAAALIAPWVEPEVAAAVHGHHEHIDGGGYPFGASGQGIPQLALVLAVVDTYEALRSDRPQRPGFAPAEAAQELRDMAGTWLAATPVAALLAVVGSQHGLAPTLRAELSPAFVRLRHALRGSAAPLTAALAALLVGVAAWAGELSAGPSTVAATAPPQASSGAQTPQAVPASSPAQAPSPAGASESPATPGGAAPPAPSTAAGSPSGGTNAASGTKGRSPSPTSTSTSNGASSQPSQATNNGSSTGSTQPGTLTAPMIIQVPPDASPNPAASPVPSPAGSPPPNPNPSPKPNPSPPFARPVIDTTSPISGPAAGGTTVTIQGSGFTGATAVTFGGAGASFQVLSDTAISAVSPPGKGIVLIQVKTPAGTSVSVLSLFTYTGLGSIL